MPLIIPNPPAPRRGFTLIFCCLASVALASADLTVLSADADGLTPGKRFELWLKAEAYRLLDERKEAFEKLKTQADLRTWQEERRAFFLRQLGGLPERTPLNPMIVGTLQGEGYAVQNILFESRPNFHVAANLYLPSTPGPWPAVIIPCGHSHDGKFAGGYQRIAILLARNGMAAMCYDPLGQGERYQMIDPAGGRTHYEDARRTLELPHPTVRFLCTSEHTYMGLGCILLGSNFAQYRIWDGMRAIDYLQSRPDILRDKIGCTGNSGGGTLTAYLAALDERIVAAAPVCYLTTFRNLITRRGAQDAEQNIFGQIAFGMDQADYPILTAPRALLIGAGTRDVTFDIAGTWEVFREAKRFYSRLGRAERVEINEADALHGFTIDQREAVARWMHRWLLGSDKLIVEQSRPDPMSDEVQRNVLSAGDWTARQLQCTPQGQVLLMPGERSVFQINADLAATLKREREAKWGRLGMDERRELVRATIGARKPGALPEGGVESLGRLEHSGVTVHKLALSPESGLQIPALAFVPAQPSGVATLYLHGTGMTADSGAGGRIETLTKQGQVVLAAELRGIGETATGLEKGDYGSGHFGRDSQEVFLAYLMGKSFVGMRTEDVHLWLRYLLEFAPQGVPLKEVHLVAEGNATLPALHAAALEPGAFQSVTLRNLPQSWEDIVRQPVRPPAANVVHGALRHYSFSHLVDLAGAGKVRVLDTAQTAGTVRSQ